MPASSETEVRLPAGVALHARPAGQFVKTAMQFRSQVWVAAGKKAVNAKSILAVLGLGAQGGTALTLSAEGDDAQAALVALAACVSSLVE
ncbi:MAG TPA: HPr family phosphocarrier protein [Candidatus Dormibacteraeota bacterium]